jgi:hypothetical protein
MAKSHDRSRAGRFAILLCGVLATSASACIYSPEDGDELRITQTRTLYGLHNAPNQTLEVQAFNRSSGNWDTVGTTESLGNPFQWAGFTWYYWSYPFNLSGVDNWHCYLRSNCQFTGGAATLSLRVATPGGWSLLTFKQGGAYCTQVAVGEVGLEEAYTACGNDLSDRSVDLTITGY